MYRHVARYKINVLLHIILDIFSITFCKFVLSYIVFVSINRHEGVKLCVKIIISLLYWPSLEFEDSLDNYNTYDLQISISINVYAILFQIRINL